METTKAIYTWNERLEATANEIALNDSSNRASTTTDATTIVTMNGDEPIAQYNITKDIYNIAKSSNQDEIVDNYRAISRILRTNV